MKQDLRNLEALLAVTRAGGFREAARATDGSASALSEAVRRLEARLGVRLLNRSTRSVVPTEAGRRLVDRLGPALAEVEAALLVVDGFRDRPAGTLKLNVPIVAARLILPAVVPPFLALYPDIRMEVIADDGFVDVLAAGCDAGIRYGERLGGDMIAVPIGPRVQRFATAAAPSYLARRGVPRHPRELVDHSCLRGQFASGAMAGPWEFEKVGEFEKIGESARGGEVVRVEPDGPLLVRIGAAADLAVEAAIAGTGLVHLFEGWLRPHLDAGRLVPVLEEWWQPFPGPFLYYPGRRLLPAPLRAFVDFVKAAA